MKRWVRTAVGAAVTTAMLAVTAAAASPLQNLEEVDSYEPIRGLTVTESVADIDGAPQQLVTVTADGNSFAPAIGTDVYGRALVGDMTPIDGSDAAVVAAVNGDHFSFKTGIPLGMSISNGEIITSPVPAYDADEYYFHALGITDDGDVLVGENPDLYMQFTVGEDTVMLDRINRTREQWDGEQIVLYTPAYGESTRTDTLGVELIVQVEEGEVKAGSVINGTVIGVSREGNSLLEEGTVVISAHILRLQELAHVAEGDPISISFEFADPAWNDVTFAVGGNMTIVEDGEALPYDYKLGVFKDPQPRSALGVKKNGDIVLATADGRSDEAAGMTANEMADYMAYELGCEYAILLDGGGSTAIAVADGDGALEVVNTPSEERPVGNGVLIVQTSGSFPFVYLLPVIGAVIVGAAAIAVALAVRGKNDRKNEESEEGAPESASEE